MTETYRVHLPVFEGPLDLLLSLIERQELEITRISLAQVTDQYLSHIAQFEEARPDALAEFLVMAAKLILIKSTALLPRQPTPAPAGEPDLADELASQLQEYKQFKAAAANLNDRQRQGWRTFLRLVPPSRPEAQLDLTEVTLADLVAAVREALSVPPLAPPVDIMVPQVRITTRGRMEMILQELQLHHQLLFHEMLAAAVGRLEVAVTLLATLELLKQRDITVHQERLFGAIIIRSNTSTPGASGRHHG